MVTATLAELLVRYKAIEFGEFTLASGAKSTYYIDVKSAVTHPDLLSAVAYRVAETYTFDVVAGGCRGCPSRSCRITGQRETLCDHPFIGKRAW